MVLPEPEDRPARTIMDSGTRADGKKGRTTTGKGAQSAHARSPGWCFYKDRPVGRPIDRDNTGLGLDFRPADHHSVLAFHRSSTVSQQTPAEGSHVTRDHLASAGWMKDMGLTEWRCWWLCSSVGQSKANNERRMASGG